MDLEILHCID